ncbi:hypothetical protein EMPS_07827 [Entomortierella parvispora]|uniref:Uncharacterized protein n=1 Tax=Entomortierella parvispora TaxID=205924 RepID=A0A9P3HEX2_9FUNG|nr:hypothetical protein EMPS_07827 [Entomortierella parvispora]
MYIRFIASSIASALFLVSFSVQATPIAPPPGAQAQREVVNAELVQCDKEFKNLSLDIVIGQCTQYRDDYLCQVKFANSEFYSCTLYENYQGGDGIYCNPEDKMTENPLVYIFVAATPLHAIACSPDNVQPSILSEVSSSEVSSGDSSLSLSATGFTVDVPLSTF